METRLLKIEYPIDTEALADAAAILKNGGLVVFPTETVYGIGADATSADAARAIYAAKGRPSDNPLIIHIANPEDAEPYAETNDTYYQLAKRFMPGPLTVILKRKPTIPLTVTGGLETVAVRCPAHPVARALIAAAGVPLAAPSANRSGRPSPTLASHVIEDLWGRVDMIIDGGAAEVGLESTIVALDGARGTLLRPGAITPEQLSEIIPDLTIAPAVLEALGENERPLSPGMKYKHYAPKTALTLLEGSEDEVRCFLNNLSTTAGVGILCFDEEIPFMPKDATLFPVGNRDDIEMQAHRFFAALRDADTTDGLTCLYAHLPPRKGLGLALYNRAIRAAAHTVIDLRKEV